MGLFVANTDSHRPEWVRQAAFAINWLLNRQTKMGRGAPVAKTADFTVADTDVFLVNNKAGSSCTVTLPSASQWSGRELQFLNYQAQTVVSASSNVVPITGGAAGTAILPATAGAWGLLVSDGANWITVAS